MYAPVSTDGPSVAVQVVQFRAAGTEKVFREVANGAKTDRRQLRRALAQLGAGDVLAPPTTCSTPWRRSPASRPISPTWCVSRAIVRQSVIGAPRLTIRGAATIKASPLLSGDDPATPSAILRGIPEMVDTLSLTAGIVSAHVSRNTVQSDQLPELIRCVFDALASASSPGPEQQVREPAVPVLKSIFKGHLVCLECGRSFRTMKYHLEREHGLTTGAYRARFNLPNNYPLVAPEFAAVRAQIAKRIGLGRKSQVNRSTKPGMTRYPSPTTAR